MVEKTESMTPTQWKGILWLGAGLFLGSLIGQALREGWF